MLESNQNKQSEPKGFIQPPAEILDPEGKGLEQFRASVNPDTMGFEGKEGIDDDGQSIINPIQLQ